MLNAQYSNKIKWSHRSAFTLIELSIVLVIVGLLIGAISSGSILIKQATLRAVISEIRNYQTGINTFKLVYGAIPGDLANATDYWNTTNNGPLATGLVNGNGNGYLDSWPEGQAGMQMLSLAGFIQNIVGYGIDPSSKYGNNTYYTYNNCGWGSCSYYGRPVGLGADDIVFTTSGYNGVIPSLDAYYIDNKMDDGVLYSGFIIIGKGTNYSYQVGKCTNLATNFGSTFTSSPAITADSYNFADTSPSCYMVFYIVD